MPKKVFVFTNVIKILFNINKDSGSEYWSACSLAQRTPREPCTPGPTKSAFILVPDLAVHLFPEVGNAGTQAQGLIKYCNGYISFWFYICPLLLLHICLRLLWQPQPPPFSGWKISLSGFSPPRFQSVTLTQNLNWTLGFYVN